MGGAASDPKEALSQLAALDEDALDKLVADLGADDDDDGADDSTATAEGDQAAPRLDGGTPEDKDKPETPQGKEPTPSLTGAALLDAFKTDPNAQALVKSELDSWLKNASAQADAKKEQEDFKRLIDTGDYDEIGRRYVAKEQTDQIRTAAEEAALTRAYTDIYGGLFKELASFDLTDTEKMSLDADKFATDAEYVLALTSFINEKKGGSDFEARVQQVATERLEALKNQKSAKAVNNPSISALPGGRPTPTGSETQSSRSLLQEGFAEVLESAANGRVGLNEE